MRAVSSQNMASARVRRFVKLVGRLFRCIEVPLRGFYVLAVSNRIGPWLLPVICIRRCRRVSGTIGSGRVSCQALLP